MAKRNVCDWDLYSCSQLLVMPNIRLGYIERESRTAGRKSNLRLTYSLHELEGLHFRNSLDPLLTDGLTSQDIHYH